MPDGRIWDAAIAGGGPAGAAAAIVLARAGRRALLLDPAGGLRGRVCRKVGESLPGGARPLLRRLGALEAVEDGRHLASGGVWSAWSGETLIESHAPLASPHGAGWHLDRAHFDRNLRRLAAAAGAAVEGGRLCAVERLAAPREIPPPTMSPRPRGSLPPPASAPAHRPTRWRLQLGDGSEIEARWIVDATGRAARLARALGAVRQRDDDLVAVTAWLCAADDDLRTLIEAVPDGWWYTARLPGGERVAVIHGGREDAAPLLRRPGAFAERLAETRWVGGLAGGSAAEIERRLADGPRGAEAGGARLDRFAGDGWLAAGDAALSFDPLSSQGMIDALYTGVLAGEAVDAALGGDPGPAAEYPAYLERIRAAYLRHHRQAYRDAWRWRDRGFWRSRLAG